MKKYIIVELPEDDPSAVRRIVNDVLYTLRGNGGRFLNPDKHILNVASAQIVPREFSLLQKDYKEILSRIKKNIAEELGLYLLREGRVKFTETFTWLGTTVTGTLCVFSEEGDIEE